MFYALIAVAFLGVIVTQRYSNIQSTTRWLGIELEKKKNVYLTPNTLATALEIQAMINPDGLAFRITIIYCNYVLIGGLVTGLWYYMSWWIAVLGFSLIFFGGTIIAVFLFPRNLSYWIKWVLMGIENRIANYKKENDNDRAQCLSAFLPDIYKLEALAITEKLDIRRILV